MSFWFHRGPNLFIVMMGYVEVHEEIVGTVWGCSEVTGIRMQTTVKRQQTRDRDHIPHIDASQLLHALSSASWMKIMRRLGMRAFLDIRD